jgi:hypothetical protein
MSKLKMAVFWVVAPMEAARTSETLVNFYQTTRCYNPEDSHLHNHRRENLKSYLMSKLPLQQMITNQSNYQPTQEVLGSNKPETLQICIKTS